MQSKQYLRGFWRRQRMLGRAAQAVVETLEERKLLSLAPGVGIGDLGVPIIKESGGQISYDASSNSFDLTTQLVFISFDNDPNNTTDILPDSVPGSPTLQLHVRVANDGSFSGPGSDADLVLEGTIAPPDPDYGGGYDLNGNGGLDPGDTVSGVLLTGKASDFGFEHTSDNSDTFNFRFTPTGGILEPLFFAHTDIGVVIYGHSVSGDPLPSLSFENSFSELDQGFLGSVSRPDHGGLAPAISLVKLTDGTDNDSAPGLLLPAGSTVTWTYNVNNEGGEPITNVLVTDDQAGVNPVPSLSGGFNVGDGNVNGLLDPGETWVYTASGTAVAGQYTNTGTVTGTSTITHASLTATNPDNYYGLQPAISIVKKTNGTDNDTGSGPLVPVGSTVAWSYQVTNTGNVALNNVVVKDDNGTPGNTADDFTVGTITSLAPGASATLTATGIAQAGQYGNVGTATGTDSIGETVNATNPDHYFGASPAISLVKETNGTDNNTPTGPAVPVGGLVTWTYIITNTGNVALNGVSVVDDNGTPANTADDFTISYSGTLAPGASTTLTATGSALAGQYTNSATASGTDSLNETVSATDVDNYFGDAPAIHIVKYVNGNDANDVPGVHVPTGSTLAFTYVVTNTGNAPLKNVSLGDDVLGAITSFTGDTNGNGLLDTSETWTFTKAAVAVAGQQTNTGTVNADDAHDTGQHVSDHNPANYFGDAPAIHIVKYVNGNDADTAPGINVPTGSSVTFTYVVTNTGNVPLANIALTDDKLGAITSFSGDTNGNSLLDLSETWTFTKTATASAGQQTNTGTVTANDAFIPTSTVSDNNPANYFGYVKVTIGDLVWQDSNGNGIQDGGEAGIAGVTLTLSGTDFLSNPVNDHATTDANGKYQFTELPGTYTVAVTAPTGYVATVTGKGTTATDSNVSPSGTTPGTLASGGSDQTIDFGFYQPVTIGNFVWNDLNANGIQNAGEIGISGVTLTLTGTNGAGVAVTDHATTNASGAYLFTEAPGAYTVTVDASNFTGGGALAIYTASPTLQGSDRTVDSNANPSGTTPATLVGGGSDLSIDFGYFKPIVISGHKYQDMTGDGLSDDDKSHPLAGVTIQLYHDVKGNGVLDSGDPKIGSTTTASDGSYSFTGLAPDNYLVQEVVPSGYVRTAPLLADYYAVNTACGGSYGGFDFANFFILPCPNNITKVSYTINNCTTVTDLRGQTHQGDIVTMTFTVKPSAYAWISLVSYAAPAAAFDANTAVQQQIFEVAGNHIFSGSASGTTYTLQVDIPNGYFQVDAICGAPIEHFGPAGSNIFYSAEGRLLSADNGGCAPTLNVPAAIGDFVWLDKNGNGIQDSGEPGISGVTVNLLSGLGNIVATTTTNGSGKYSFTQLFPANYYVQFVAPGGYSFTQADVGTNNAVDSDANTTTGKTALIKLTANQTDNTWDAGLYQPVSIGDYVWNDADTDGIQDNGESGIAGVKVDLLFSNQLIATSTTDAGGHYLFSNLAPGSYQVKVDASSFASGGALVGFTASATGQGSDRTLDSNAQPASTTLASGNSDLSIDFGYYQTPATLGQGDTATIGFWQNCNGQALIKALNGNSCSTKLGNWLAATFPNLYGTTTGSNNMAGKTNSQVAAYFVTLFKITGTKSYAQVLAAALAVYSTNSTLAGGTYAAKYGFNVSSAGTGAETYNAGANGSALGLSNGATYTIMQLLVAVNAKASGGVLPSAPFSAANTIFDGVNQTGDIS